MTDILSTCQVGKKKIMLSSAFPYIQLLKSTRKMVKQRCATHVPNINLYHVVYLKCILNVHCDRGSTQCWLTFMVQWRRCERPWMTLYLSQIMHKDSFQSLYHNTYWGENITERYRLNASCSRNDLLNALRYVHTYLPTFRIQKNEKYIKNSGIWNTFNINL